MKNNWTSKDELKSMMLDLENLKYNYIDDVQGNLTSQTEGKNGPYFAISEGNEPLN